MVAAMPTPSQRLAALILRQPLRDWIETRRAAGLSWRAIAAELDDITAGQVAVTGESVRLWSAEEAKAS